MNLRRLCIALFCAGLTLSLTSSVFAQAPLKREDDRDLQQLREEYFYGPRRDLTGRTPAGARVNALRAMDQMKPAAKAARSNGSPGRNGLSLSTTTWTMVGPQPTSTLGNEFFATTSGRISAVAVDPTDANIVYIGAAMGGVWKTTDGGANWTPLTDSQPSLAIGSLAIDPSNHLNVYAGTGEENFNGDGYYGAGILKSTDGGANWTSITGPFGGPASTTLGGSFIGGIAVSPSNGQILLASVRRFTNSGSGIFRSTDGGATWSPVLSNGTVPALTNSYGTSVVFDPTNGNIAYAGIGRPSGSATEAGVYRSANGGATWSKLPGTGANLFPTTNVGRVVVAIAPSAPATLYVAVANSLDSTLLGVFKTTDSGANWAKLVNTPDYCAGSNPQCNYDNELRVHPTNANVVFAGGQDVGPPHVRGTSLYGTFDGGATWTSVSPGPGAGAEGLHPDTHAIAFSANGGKMYTGNDGGMWSTTSTTSAPVTWTNLNATLAITQFYPGLSFHPTNRDISFGGTQDNGTESSSGTLVWGNPNPCGDGGWTAIDPATPANVYTTCQLIDIEKSTTAGSNNSFTQVISGINTGDRVLFIPPLVMDPSNPLTLYFGTFKLYQTTDGAGSWTAMAGGADLTGGAGKISAIAVAPSDPNTVYVGANNGTVSVSTNAGAGATAVFNTRIANLPPTRMVSNIAVDPTNASIAYLTFSGFSGTGGNFADNLGHVFKTINAGGAWTDISGNLPNIPANDIVIDPDISATLYVATDIGVFQTVNGGTTWTTLGAGLPRVAVLSLKMHHPTRVLRAATHGRSVWDLQLANSPLAKRRLVQVTSE